MSRRHPDKPSIADNPPPGIDWERSTPRCESCVHRRASRTLLNPHGGRAPVIILPPLCRLYWFKTADGAICKDWQGRNGDRLEE